MPRFFCARMATAVISSRTMILSLSGESMASTERLAPAAA